MKLTCRTCGVAHTGDCPAAWLTQPPGRIRCAEAGCTVELDADPRHVDNLRAAGWRCAAHRAVV